MTSATPPSSSWPSGNPEGRSRATCQQGDGFRQVDKTIFNQLQREWQSRLQANNAIHRNTEFNILFIDVMWRMIRGNRINSSICNPLAYGFSIFSAAQRRVHFGVGVVAANGFISQGEVMWCRFAGHV